MTTRYALQPSKRLVESIHEVWIDPDSKAAFQNLAASHGLSVRGALTQIIEKHARIREPFSPRSSRPWAGEAAKGRARYTAALPGVEVAPDVAMALLIDANRVCIRRTEAVRQLVWRCIQASA